MPIISSTTWDSGTTTWDSGSTLWDPHRQIEPNVVTIVATPLAVTITRPVIDVVNTPSLTVTAYAANVVRTTNVTSESLNLTALQPDIGYVRTISVANVPAMSLSEQQVTVIEVTRNLTFLFSPII